MSCDGIQDHFEVAKDLVVPEAQDCPSLGFQPAVPHHVSAALVVLLTVALDDYPMCEACEVDDVAPDDYLPSKMTLELMASQPNPQHGLRFGHVLAKFACALPQTDWIWFHRTTVSIVERNY